MRVSSRAKRVNLTMSADAGLVVVVPRGYDVRRIPALLEVAANRRWIARAAGRVAAARAMPLPLVDDVCPAQIPLPAIGEAWTVAYQGLAGPALELRQTGDRTLAVVGPTGSSAARRTLLRRWIHRKAKAHLIPWLGEVSAATGLPFTRVTVRAQRTRWGSCSQRQSISLNLKLLFLPPEVARYVLVHELCHTVHPNHSADFWRLVARHEPGWQERRAALRVAGRYVPGWLGGG